MLRSFSIPGFALMGAVLASCAGQQQRAPAPPTEEQRATASRERRVPYEEMQDIHDRRQARQQETTPVEEQAQRSRQGEAVGFCPLQIPGTRVLISESEQSIVLTWLTGDEEKVEQLREMVHQMTASYASEVEAGAKESPPLGASGEAVVPGLVRSENIEGGVKQFYVPQATTQRDALQRQLTQRLQQMSQGFCPELIS